MDKNEAILHSWKQKLEKLAANPENILLPENEALLLNPYQVALEIQGIKSTPHLTKMPWDEPSVLSLFRTTGKTYRKFWEESNNYEGRVPLKPQFLVYKRYKTDIAQRDIPRGAKYRKVSGLQGVMELLYNPTANLPKEGRKVNNTFSNEPVLEKRDTIRETNPLVGEFLTVQHLIPVGNEGFYLFCSEQQKNPQKHFPGENSRLITGPNAQGTRIRTAHLFRSLCNGKPEETPKAKDLLEKHCKILQTRRLERILEVIEKSDLLHIPTNTLHLETRKFEDKKEGIDSLNKVFLGESITLAICYNSSATHSGTDYAIELRFGEANKHEQEVENQLISYWRENLTT